MAFGKITVSLLLGVAGVAPAAQKPAVDLSFPRDVYPIFQAANCQACHNTKGVASATRLQFPEADAPAARVEAFGKSLAALVDRNRPEQSLLLNKPANRIPHTGGKLITPDSREESLLLGWIRYLAARTPEEIDAETGHKEAASPAPGLLLRRLTHSQYNNTVRDLLGDVTNPANQFPPEDFIGGFKNQQQGQSISPLLAEAYSAAAEKLARSAFRGPPRGNDSPGLIPCQPVSPTDAGCRARFLRAFGLRAFRRPLHEDEFRRYAALHEQGARAGGDFLGGAQLAAEAMLQSPQFLFRMERESNPRLRPYAAASRLSYFLWDSMPDEALFRSAAAGELDTPAGLEKLARRMLDDPRARRALDEFVSQWLRFDRVLNSVKDRRQFPQFNIELAVAMTEETRRFVSHLVWDGRNFMDFYSAPYSFLNGDLAALYNLAPPAEDFGRVDYPAGSERAGILGQASFLALTSKPGDTSPTARGLFVREQFLCQHVPEPPPGTNTNLPPLAEARPQTNRERLAVHLNNESCASCHTLIDPIGYGFERFDAIGAHREKQKLTFLPARQERQAQPKTVELELETAGWIAGIEDSRFASPKELGRVLAGSPTCQECVVKQVFRYAAGREETAADTAVLRRITRDFQASQFRFKELMVAVARWTEFPPEPSPVR